MSSIFGDSWFLLTDDLSLRWMLTLLHFLWQGAVIGVVVVILAKLLRHRSATLRYGLYLFALLGLPCCVALTFCVIDAPVRITTAATVPPAKIAYLAPAETGILPESPVMIPPMIPLAELPQGNVPESPIMANSPPLSIREDEAPAEPQWITLLSLFAPWITICYAMGAFGFLLRLTIALWGGHRLRASATRLTDSRLLGLITTEARQVGLRLVPIVAYCERVAVPTVVGILRPVVLLPASVITGLTSEEFSAIIGHEFAHIRRYDLWVNLLQRVIESLLFFHPVVWFLSRRLSAERELCCDDLVVRSGCAPMNYAGALLRMAELCAASRPTNVAALAANGDEPSLLEHRIQRLMNAGKTPRLQLTRAGVLALMLTLVSSLATPGLIRSWTWADEPEKAISDRESGVTESVPKQRPRDQSPEINASVAPKPVRSNFPDENGKTAETDVVEIKYPHCIVDAENLKTRSLADAVTAFNREAQESPVGVLQQPITEKETLEAIAMSLNDAHFGSSSRGSKNSKARIWRDNLKDAVKAVLREIAVSKQFPPNAYFRRFTRFDDERQMNEVWWVRLVVEPTAGPVYSVPVRTTSLKSRPYTQMERQQNASGGLTLINRFVSYFAEPPNILLAKEFPKDAIDQLVNSVETSIKAKNAEIFQSLFDWNGVSDETREFVKSEFAMLADSTIHSVKVTPRNFRGELVHWSAYQHYEPNLEIVGYLDIEFSNTDQRVDRRRTLSLEMGQVGNELRLVNYVPKGERKLPHGKIEGLSIRGRFEELADGTTFETHIITNPGTLLSGHVVNEEVRQRDPENAPPEDELEPKANNETSPNIQPAPNQQPARVTEFTDAQRRELILKAVAEADLIPDEQARMKAQWDLVASLVTSGLHDDAFQQAMKLRTANPQMCIYSLKTIADDAIKRGDQAMVSKTWDAAKKSNTDSGTKFNHYVIELGFRLNQPVSEMLAIAAASKRDDQRRAYQDVRNELTWRGRIDEAYAVTNAHLLDLPKDINDREMAYYCSSARSYDYDLKHDHIGQAIRIIEQMPKGQHRDAAISQLIDGLLYVANKDQVSDERLVLAESWVGRIDDPLKQATAKAAILQRRLPGTSVEELERRFAAIDSREEKLTILRNIFQKLLEEGQIGEADLILPREVQLVKEQPRPEQKSKFGNVNDDDVIRMTTWTHNAAIVRALHKASRIDEAKRRLESMKELPDSEPVLMVGNLADIRLQLYMELGDFDAVEKFYIATPSVIGTLNMAAWMMEKGQFDRGWNHAAQLIDLPWESFAPQTAKTKSLYFSAAPFENIARQLFNVNRTDAAFRFISKLPESRDTAHAFETFGELLVSHGHAAELDQWIARLPHETAKTHTRMGAVREISKLPAKATAP